MNRAEIIRTIELLDESKKDKWYKESLDYINSSCPFCHDARIKKYGVWGNICSFCLCPSSICVNHGSEGYMKILLWKYLPHCRVYDMDSEDLNHMIILIDEEIKRYMEMLK